MRPHATLLVALSIVGLVQCDGLSPFINDGQLASRMDVDGDGVPRPEDCNDRDPSITTLKWYLDSDDDGYGAGTAVSACTKPLGHVARAGDCNDDDKSINPDTGEDCTPPDPVDAGEDDVGPDAGDSSDVGDTGSDGDVSPDNGDTDGGNLPVDCSVVGCIDLETANVKLTGEAEGDYAGRFIIPAKDMGGDGVDDLIVSAPFADANSNKSGAVYILFAPISADKSLATADVKISGETANDQAGQSVASFSDLSGDGKPDLAIGVANNGSELNQAGAVYILFGPVSEDKNLSQANVKILGESAGDNAGFSVANVGDVNNDGKEDLAIGAPSANQGSGVVYVFFGPIGGDVSLSDADVTLRGIGDSDQTGRFIAKIGDINDDQKDDLAISAPSSNNGKGSVHILLGPISDSSSLEEAEVKFEGNVSTGVIGQKYLGRDVTGDGKNDLVLSSPNTLYIFHGPITQKALEDAETIIASPSPEASLNGSIAVGDHNHDGTNDLVVGTPSDNLAHPNAGTTHVFHGPITAGSKPLLGAAKKFTGTVEGEMTGHFVAFGFVNDDNSEDLIIGAFSSNRAFNDAGAAYIVFGKTP